MSQKLSVVGILAGDLEHQLDMKVKYGVFFDVLAQHVDLIEVYDASLHGIRRYLNALKVFHPSRHIWKERFFKNVSAFKARSKKVAVHLRNFSDELMLYYNSVRFLMQLRMIPACLWLSIPIIRHKFPHVTQMPAGCIFLRMNWYIGWLLKKNCIKALLMWQFVRI